MERSRDEQFLHDWVIQKIKEKYSRLYKEVHTNPGEEKNFDGRSSFDLSFFRGTAEGNGCLR